MKTAVIYARYSSDSQTEQSIEGQLRVCHEYAKQHDTVILDAYIDRAMTGTNDNRPAFQKMIRDSEKQHWDYVIVYKLDRFARNKYESVINKKRLQDNNVKLMSAMENLTDTPEGRMMECFLEGMNQYFSEELMQKVRRGLNESWLKGNATGGRKVFGYDVVNQKYVINEKEAATILEIFTKYSQGYTAEEIAKSLQERGIKYHDEKYLSNRTIFKLLHKLKYTGKVEHGGIVYDKVYPQIISDELWRKVEMIHQQNKIAPSSKKAVYEYILTGKLVCGVCKKKMSGASGSSKAKRVHYYYVCNSHKKGEKCTTTSVQKDYIEDLVINSTMAFLSDDETVTRIANSVYTVLEKEAKDNSSLKLLENKKAQAQKSAGNIIKAIEEGIITEQTKTRLKELEMQINQYDFEIDKEKQKTHQYLSRDQIKNYISSKFSANSTDLQFRKMIVNTFIREIVFFEDKLIITYNFAPPTETVAIDARATIEIEKQSESALSYSERHNRKITIAYLLAPGINDRASDVRQLGKWFRGKNVLINLLQYNETACKRIKRPNKQQLVAFKIRLEEAGLEVKLRESRGNRIKAACGQLVSDYNKGNDAPTSDSPEKMSPVIHKLSDNKADTTRGIRKEKRHPFAKHKAKRKRKKN